MENVLSILFVFSIRDLKFNQAGIEVPDGHLEGTTGK